MGKIIGIDLGKSDACLSVMEGGKPVVIHGTEEFLPDISPALVLKNRKEAKISGRVWSPEEQAALFLRRVKRAAEEYLGEKVTETVISVPGHFSYFQRQSVRDAAKIAGMTAVRLISEPTASAIAYCVKDRSSTHLLSVTVKDGFTDLVILENGDGVIELMSGRSCPVSGDTDRDISALTKETLNAAGREAIEINMILVSGEKRYFPEITETLRQKFPNAGILHMPEESLATGAAYMGGRLSGDAGCADWFLLDIVQETLSIETQGGVSTTILSRDATIPIVNRQIFSTSEDNQKAVDIWIYEGEQALVKDNTRLGYFQLSDIEPAKKGDPRIEVTFDIDTNGILSVSAKNQKTGLEKSCRFFSVNLSEESIKKSRLFLETIQDSHPAIRRKPAVKSRIERKEAPERAVSSGVSFAEFENYRRRTEQEKEKMFDAGAKSILEQFLPLLDNFERALGAALKDPQENPYTEGILMIYNQLMKNLRDAGITQIPSIGKAFDPAYHSAVMHVKDPSVGTNIITEEFQKGYLYKGTVLRYSMVKVAN